MHIILNGETLDTPQTDNLAQLLQQQPNLPEQYAIAVNGAFVAQGLYAETPIQAGDQIELLVPMQGG